MIKTHTLEKYEEKKHKPNPKAIFKEKLAALCRIQNHNIQHSRLSALSLIYRGSSADLSSNHPYKLRQSKQASQPDKQVKSNLA